MDKFTDSCSTFFPLALDVVESFREADLSLASSHITEQLRDWLNDLPDGSLKAAKSARQSPVMISHS